jgi:hypothetical protein
MQRLLVILLTLFVLASCEKEVKLGIADNVNQLVVVGHFNPDTVFSIFVSATTSATDPINPGFFDNAEVDIYEDGVLLENLIIPPERRPFYQSVNSRPVPGKEYEVRVGFPGNPTRAIGKSYVPEPVPVLSAWITDVEKRNVDNFDQEVEYTIKVDVLLNNMTDVNPFTHLEFFRDSVAYEVVNNDTLLTPTGQRKRLEVLTTPNELLYLIHFEYGVLTSGDTNNSSELKYSFSLRTRINSQTEVLPQIFLNARSISEDYYLYHTTLTRQIRQSSDTLFNNPVNVYDNIDNGSGIFAGYSSSIDTIPLR